MLISVGDYKSFQKLTFIPDASKSSTVPYDEAHMDRISSKYELLRLLSQPDMSPEMYINTCLMAMYGLVRTFEVESCFGSTEALETSTREDLIQKVKTAMQESIRWSDIYQILLHEDRVWDLKDLFVASVPMLGWQELGESLLNKASFPEILRSIMGDWIGSYYDESTTLAFLDLFTSLVLQEVFGNGTDPRLSLCLDYARRLSNSVLETDPQNTRSRPFIQWILARSAFEMRKARDSRDIIALKGFPGLLLRQGNGVHLPIFVPQRGHLERPDWHSFVMRPEVTQEHSLQVALKAARFLGDYGLQSTCLKLLILQSSEPTSYMNDLATLQLEKQQDKEGFLGTCLSKYLVTRPTMSAAMFLGDIKRLDQVSGGSYLKRGVNASLLWANSMIREALLSAGAGEATSSSTAAPDRDSVLREELAIYGPRLPDYITDYIRCNVSVDIPKPIQPYRPSRIRFSESTVGGKEIPGTRKLPKRTRPRPDTSNEESYRIRTQPSRERQRLINRFEGGGKNAPLPRTWLESDSEKSTKR